MSTLCTAALLEQKASGLGASNATSVYRPLDTALKEIRILHISHDLSEPEGLLCCHLEHVSLLSDPAPVYEATSWSWGSSTEKQQILLDGQPIWIPKNAETVLRQMCFRQKHLKVWMDAVCINQADIPERGSQVAIMKDVYSLAALVLVWLGDDDQLGEAAFPSVDLLLEQCRENSNNFEGLSNLFKGFYGTRLYSNQALPACNWGLLRQLYSLPWFSRLWVVQEVMLSQDATCYLGKHSRPWNSIGLAAQWMEYCQYETLEYFSEGDGVVDGIATAQMTWNLKHYKARHFSIATFLRMGDTLRASNPLDKVYGILGLVMLDPEGDTPFLSSLIHLKPDYTASTRSVYTAATWAAIESRPGRVGQLSVISTAQSLANPDKHAQEEDQSWPSWVPHFNWIWHNGLGSPVPVSLDEESNGNNDIEHEWTSDPFWDPEEPNELSVEGFAVDTISWHGQSLSVTLLDDRLALAFEIFAWREAALSIGKSEKEFAVAMTQSRDDKTSFLRDHDQFLEYYNAFMQTCKRLIEDGTPYSGKFEPVAERYWRAILQNGSNRAFFHTKTGYIGMGPPRIQRKDVVCLLHGRKIPIVLSKDRPYWRLVGDTYVLGLTSGQYKKQFPTAESLEGHDRWFDIH